MKKWEITRAPDYPPQKLNDFLAEGWEPYALIYHPDTGAIHYLRRSSEVAAASPYMVKKK